MVEMSTRTQRLLDAQGLTARCRVEFNPADRVHATQSSAKVVSGIAAVEKASFIQPHVPGDVNGVGAVGHVEDADGGGVNKRRPRRWHLHLRPVLTLYTIDLVPPRVSCIFRHPGAFAAAVDPKRNVERAHRDFIQVAKGENDWEPFGGRISLVCHWKDEINLDVGRQVWLGFHKRAQQVGDKGENED